MWRFFENYKQSIGIFLMCMCPIATIWQIHEFDFTFLKWGKKRKSRLSVSVVWFAFGTGKSTVKDTHTNTFSLSFVDRKSQSQSQSQRVILRVTSFPIFLSNLFYPIRKKVYQRHNPTGNSQVIIKSWNGMFVKIFTKQQHSRRLSPSLSPFLCFHLMFSAYAHPVDHLWCVSVWLCVGVREKNVSAYDYTKRHAVSKTLSHTHTHHDGMRRALYPCP